MFNSRITIQLVKIGFGFWLQWALVTFFGFLVSLFLVEVGERPDLDPMEGAIGGAVIGLAQSLVLSQRISQAWWWILASLVSWGLMTGSGFGAIGWFAPGTEILSIRLLCGAVFGAICGLWLGVGQWLVLRKEVPASWRWIVTTAVCWSIGLSLGWTVGGVLHLLTRFFLGEVVGLALTWVIVGAMTGVALIGLLQGKLAHRRSKRRKV
ncbi:MAG: hypothetical protein AB4426_22505 [Xenococcaceae cyanobacterium]